MVEKRNRREQKDIMGKSKMWANWKRMQRLKNPKKTRRRNKIRSEIGGEKKKEERWGPTNTRILTRELEQFIYFT